MCIRDSHEREEGGVSRDLRSQLPASFARPAPLSLIHISEPTRLGMISYAVFCLKKKLDNQSRHRGERRQRQMGIRDSHEREEGGVSRDLRSQLPASFARPAPLSLIHISEPTRLGMISYAVFCLKKK